MRYMTRELCIAELVKHSGAWKHQVLLDNFENKMLLPNILMMVWLIYYSFKPNTKIMIKFLHVNETNGYQYNKEEVINL